MNILKLPKDFKAPENYKIGGYLFTKLRLADAFIDYLNVMDSMEIIKKTRGGNWPSEKMTLEENFVDLGWHQHEFEGGDSFAYAIFSKDRSEYIGCFYIYPAGWRKSVGPEVDADISYWITRKHYSEQTYKEIHEHISTFLEIWGFKNPFWSNKELPK